jgi:predicted O-methyltransferase YrrM
MTVAGVLGELGLSANENDFEAAATRLYPELAAAARSVDGKEADEAARRLEDPSPSSREAKKLLYLGVRALQPQLVVETGPFNGAASAFLLQALEDNGAGRLLSFDLPNAADALDVPLPAGRELFFHDSLHTSRQMLFEYRVAWRRLRSGGLLVSDDVSWNRAFWAFTKLHRVPLGRVGEVGVTRKP